MFPIQTYTGGIAATNGYFLSLPGGNVLVDAPDGVADWLDQIEAHVDVLLLTHQHFDHVLDAAQVKARHGCRIIAFTDLSRELTLERLYGAVSGSPFSVTEFTVDERIEGKDSVEAAGVTWRLYHVPGHSPDSVCFHWEEQQVLFGGDVLFQSGVGRTDFPGGSGRLLIQGIVEKLLPLPDSTAVYPGHGAPTTIGIEGLRNPYLQ